MILADTNIAIEFIRSNDAKLRHLIASTPAAICGITRAEVLHGARDSKHRHNLIQALNKFQQLTIPNHLWDGLGDNLVTLRASGVTVPFADAILATVAIEYDIEFWTRDAQFQYIQKALPKLQLFHEPP